MEMFRKIVKKIWNISESKVVINFLYLVVSVILSLLIMTIPIILNYLGIKYNGDNFTHYLMEYFSFLSIVLFIVLKKVEKSCCRNINESHEKSGNMN